MYKLKYLILVIVVILGLGCSKREEKSGSSASNMKLSDVKANLSGKSLFITIDESNSASRNTRLKKLNSTQNSSQTKSLIVFDNDTNLDYGIISDYNINIEQIKVDPLNKFGYMLLNYTGGNSDSDANIRALNCTIFQINLSNNEIKCIESGLAIMDVYQNMISSVNDYHLENFQFGSGNIIFFRTMNRNLVANNDLYCSKSCIYMHNLATNVTTRVSSNDWEGERFVSLGDGSIIWAALALNGSKATEILHTDNSGKTRELTSTSSGQFNGDFRAGDYLTGFWGSESHSTTTFARVQNNEVRKTFITHNLGHSIVIKGFDGKVYTQTENGLYSVLPNKNNPLVSISETWKNKKNSLDCGGYSTTCGIHFTIINGMVFYNS